MPVTRATGVSESERLLVNIPCAVHFVSTTSHQEIETAVMTSSIIGVPLAD